MSKRTAATREVPLDAIQPDGTFKYRCRTDQKALIQRLAACGQCARERTPDNSRCAEVPVQPN